MASMQFAAYGLRNPYTYQRPKITPLPNETDLTVQGGTGAAAVQGWAQQALPRGGSSIEGGTSAKGLIGHDFNDYLSRNIGGKGSFSVEGRDC